MKKAALDSITERNRRIKTYKTKLMLLFKLSNSSFHIDNNEAKKLCEME